MDRRKFLHILGLFSSATVLSSCGSETEQKKLISYLVPPQDGVLPGQALWKPSTCTECPAHCGLSVRIREGRPVKLEGLSAHPDTGGGLCMRGQAALWRLYHPERIRQPMQRSPEGKLTPISWDQADQRIQSALDEARSAGRKNLFLGGRSTGTLDELSRRFCEQLGIERLPAFEFYSHSALRQAYQSLFKRPELPSYRIERADFVLSIGADLLETFIHPVAQARALSEAAERADFNWCHLEPHLSLTGANAQWRLSIRPGSEAMLLTYLLQQLQEAGTLKRLLPASLWKALPPLSHQQVATATGLSEENLQRLIARWSQASHPLLVVGGSATAQAGGFSVALLAALCQWAAGMVGDTVDFARAQNYAGVGSLNDMQAVTRRLNENQIGVALLAAKSPLGQFSTAFSQASLRVAIADLPDADTERADLVLPISHSLESWGDVEPRQGLLGLIQPLVKPLHGSRSLGDILLELLRRSGQAETAPSYQQHLFAAWSRRLSEAQLKDFSRQGFIEQSLGQAQPRPDFAATTAALVAARRPEPLGAPALIIVPSIRTFDGRSRSIPLLSEIPDPLTTISYGSWLCLGQADLKGLKLKEQDQVRLTLGEQTLELAVKEQPGLAKGIWTVQRDLLDETPLAIDLESGEAILLSSDLALQKTGNQAALAILSGSPSQHGRGIIPDPKHLEAHSEHPQASLYPEHAHPEYRWAMAVDLKRCNGCSACVAACYIENSVPVVGVRDHLKGREMSWLRIEPFYDAAGQVDFIPMLCQHCHNAPCEPVCPVYAAYHNGEGLNVQVYDRCVGTRYCANNCPYKVRRFNWWDHRWPPPLDQMVNPDLSIRTRGIMEKCTFCIQRLRTAKDQAKDEGRKVRDGEVTTACAQSCPTQAIVFGNLLDKDSRIYQLAHSERAYRVFEQLGTEPSVYYLKREGRDE